MMNDEKAGRKNEVFSTEEEEEEEKKKIIKNMTAAIIYK